MTEQTKDIGKKDSLRELLNKAEPAIRAMLPKHLRPERFMRLAYAAAKNPKLRDCTPFSLVSCIVMSSQIGLELGPGGVWLVPFRNNKAGGRMECQIIVDYRGLCELTLRTEKVTAIEARAVKEGDIFKYSYGLTPTLIHEPGEDKARGKIKGAYAIARLKDGPEQFVYLTIEQIEDYRKRSKAANDGPWVTDYEAMCLKTAVRRLTNLLPKSTEMATALEAERRAEEDEQIGDLIDAEGWTWEEEPYKEPKAKSQTTGQAETETPKADPPKTETAKPEASEKKEENGKNKALVDSFVALADDLKTIIGEAYFNKILGNAGRENVRQVYIMKEGKDMVKAWFDGLNSIQKEAIVQAHSGILRKIGMVE